ncbi:hypothetical protein [Saccharopolyspora sp. 5N708]|uniref:hypothetical protein n=1 Tax=Saccharopolyspora sp. 5N708 TaxID=3457424 RepID=UPI003FD4C30F
MIVALIHALYASEVMEEAFYVGILFIVGAVVLLYAAVMLLYRPSFLPWLLGGLVNAGMFVGFILSRTTGLPGYRESDWDTAGIVSMALEAVFLITWAVTSGVLDHVIPTHRGRAAPQ